MEASCEIPAVYVVGLDGDGTPVAVTSYDLTGEEFDGDRDEVAFHLAAALSTRFALEAQG